MNLLLLHAAATWALVGLIWTVQLVQYPGFARIRGPEFASYHAFHCNRITWVVAPLMGLELLTGIGLFLEPPPGLSTTFLLIGISSIGLNWLATAFVSMPLHGRLSRRQRSAQDSLVWTNWIRTFTWSLRGLWVLMALRLVWSAS
jgi:hypothetical protein